MPDRRDHNVALLAQALLDEERARAALGEARQAQARALADLRSQGVPASLVAAKLAHARGEALTLSDRLRLAERLRKRAWRGTRRPADLAASHGREPSATSPSDRALPPTHEESSMPKLVKKTTTVTEEFVEQDHNEADEHEGDLDEEVEEEEKDEAPPSKRRR